MIAFVDVCVPVSQHFFRFHVLEFVFPKAMSLSFDPVLLFQFISPLRYHCPPFTTNPT